MRVSKIKECPVSKNQKFSRTTFKSTTKATIKNNHKSGKSIRSRKYNIIAIKTNCTKESFLLPTRKKRRLNP